jgi:hypothetical protein
MRIYKLFLSLVVPVVLAACSIHPLPEDFSRSATFDIVQKIRCEAREAIVEIALTNAGRGRIDAFLGEPAGEAKAARIERARALLLPDLQRAAIGYSFKFAITENNNGSGAALFEVPFSNGSFSLGLNVGEDKRRKSERSFDLVEDFAQVLGDPSLHCGPSGGKDWKYPITGEIGLKEVIKTYVRLADLRIFSPPVRSRSGGDNAGSGGRGSGGQTGQGRDIYEFTDELTFTTIYAAELEPSLQLKPVAHDFRLTRASASLGGRREDIHSVTIALKAPGTGSERLSLGVPPVGQRGIAPLGAAVSPQGVPDAKDDVLTTLQNRKNRELRFPSE